MPSIQQIIAFKEKYGIKNNVTIKQLNILRDSYFQPTYHIKNSLASQGLDTNIITFFENQSSANILMLFVDITGFSKKCQALTNSQLANYLDDYYDLVIPVIYHHGGEIEKIMGDGIIAIFGQPFLGDSKDSLFERADKCAKDLIILLRETDKEVKVALHDGNVMYYKNKTLSHPEYTVIGKPLTELYRLESVALNNSISFFYVSLYENKEYCKDGAYCVASKSPSKCGYFKRSDTIRVELQGVDWNLIRHLNCNYTTK